MPLVARETSTAMMSRRTGLLLAAASMTTGVAWWAVSSRPPPHSSSPPGELSRVLERIVPPRAVTIFPPSYETRDASVTGITEFEVRVGWDEYRAWLATTLALDWHSRDGGAESVSYTRHVPGDAYTVSIQRLHEAPLRIRATAVGMPD
jgi:hypothetical protein